jgi:Cu(I)/Ag(I) efflux system membrane fusion protein
MTPKTKRSSPGWKSIQQSFLRLVGDPPGLVKVAVVLLAGILIGVAMSDGEEAPSGPTPSAAPVKEAPTVWTCSMDMQIRRSGPGQCPICSMDLVPLDNDGDDEELGPRVLQMSEVAAALASIQTSVVSRQHIAHEVRMVGKVVPDETLVAHLTAWVPGRLERVFVDYTGVTVREGDHMVELYSPELYSTQQELLRAIETEERLAESPVSLLYESSKRLVEASRERLRLWGMTAQQIDEIVVRGEPEERSVIHAPIGGVVLHKSAFEGMYVETGTRIYTIADLSSVWVVLDAYESDLQWLRYGQDVDFTTEAYPGRAFHGRIAFIDPVLDDRTRTVKVRLNVPNEDLLLKPDMFVGATVSAVLTPHGRVVDSTLAGKWMCPMHPEVLADGPEDCSICGMDLQPVTELGFVTSAEHEAPLVIPSTAPLITGKRAVVYVKLPDQERPTFEGREVVLGPRGGDYYVVHEGLNEGDEVVTNGAFKIDSELQIRARPSMMNPEGGGPAPGHQHGGGTPQPASKPAEPKQASDEHTGHGDMSAMDEPLDVPAEFLDALRPVTEGYLALQASLAGDDGAEAALAAERLEISLAAVSTEGLDGAAMDRWMEIRAALALSAGAVSAQTDLEPQRAAMPGLSGAMEQLLNAFGKPDGLEGVAVFHCPMAASGEGADWLQLGDEVQNPYYGAAMPGCGHRVRGVGEER